MYVNKTVFISHIIYTIFVYAIVGSKLPYYIITVAVELKYI